MFQDKARSPLESLVGEQLSAVVFVQDYLQLQFDGSVLSLYIWPSVKLAEIDVIFGQTGYRDLLCHQIGKIISSVRDDGEELTVNFMDGSFIRVRFEEADDKMQEIAMFQHLASGKWTVWRPGDL
jgi:hypothetical protein